MDGVHHGPARFVLFRCPLPRDCRSLAYDPWSLALKSSSQWAEVCPTFANLELSYVIGLPPVINHFKQICPNKNQPASLGYPHDYWKAPFGACCDKSWYPSHVMDEFEESDPILDPPFEETSNFI